MTLLEKLPPETQAQILKLSGALVAQQKEITDLLLVELPKVAGAKHAPALTALAEYRRALDTVIFDGDDFDPATTRTALAAVFQIVMGVRPQAPDAGTQN